MIFPGLLTQNALCKKCTSDADRNVSVKETFELSKIRVERVETRELTDKGFVFGVSATMWFDSQVSKPKNFVPEIGMMIEAGGFSYTIKSVSSKMRGNKTCFYECGMV